MKLLIDTHVMLWLLFDSAKLKPATIELINQADASYVSVASFWEVAIKAGSGKLPYDAKAVIGGASAAGLQRLGIEDSHLLQLSNITIPHHDPFDRLLLSQATSEGYHLLTVDRNILSTTYDVIAA